MISRPTFPPSDAFTLGKLTKDPRLTFEERCSIQGALRRLEELETERSWRNPYTEAIAVLERAARAHEGSFG